MAVKRGAYVSTWLNRVNAIFSFDLLLTLGKIKNFWVFWVKVNLWEWSTNDPQVLSEVKNNDRNAFFSCWIINFISRKILHDSLWVP